MSDDLTFVCIGLLDIVEEPLQRIVFTLPQIQLQQTLISKMAFILPVQTLSSHYLDASRSLCLWPSLAQHQA